jgi:4-hydroxyphenylpyruvate dioxygenase
VYAHINDAPAGPTSEVHDRRRLAPGEGVIDLAGFCKGLKQAGYEGPIGVEIFTETPPAQSALELACRAAKAAKKVVGAG